MIVSTKAIYEVGPEDEPKLEKRTCQFHISEVSYLIASPKEFWCFGEPETQVWFKNGKSVIVPMHFKDLAKLHEEYHTKKDS